MSNGRLNTSDLAVIPGGTKMGGSALIRADLLPGLIGLQAAYAKRWGDPLRPTSAADGYRSYDSQVRAFLGRYVQASTGEGPFSDIRYWQGRRYVRVSGASAAVPGTSNHGLAIAVDFADVGATNGPRWSWLMDHAPRFGFVNPLWARDGNPRNGSQEPWHWEGRAVPVSSYRPILTDLGVHVPGVTAPAPIAPLPAPQRRRTVYVIKGAEKPHNYLTDGLTKRYIGTPTERGELLRLCGQDRPYRTHPDADESPAGPLVIGQYACDRIPDWQPEGTVDVGAIADAVAAKVTTGHVNPETVAAAVADVLAHRLTNGA